MFRIINISFLFFIVLISNIAHAQSKIYFSNKSIDGEITSIDSGTVSYMTNASSEEVTREIDKILLAINGNGAFIIPVKLDQHSKDFNRITTDFINNKIAKPTSDVIYKTDNSVLHINIAKADKNNFVLADNTVLQKKEVIAIIFRDGHHSIFGPVEKAAQIMWDTEQENKAEAMKKSIQQTTANQIVESTKPEQKNPAIAPASADNPPVNSANKPIESTEKKPTEQTATTPMLAATDSLDPEIVQDFVKKAKDKVQQFTDLVKTIMTDEEKADKAIAECAALFVPTAEIQVSSLYSGKVPYPILVYLKRIKSLPYERVDVTYTNVAWVSKIHLGPGGKYYGTIKYEQTFTGFRDNKIVYSDRTEKNTDVILDTYRSVNNGISEIKWDILLGNIYVVSTKEVK